MSIKPWEGVLEPGAWQGVPVKEYFSWPGYSKSFVAAARDGYPADWEWLLTHPIVQSLAMIIGSAVDYLIYDGQEAFSQRYAEEPIGVLKRDGTPYADYLSSVPGKAWIRAQAEAGITILTRAQMATIQRVVLAVSRHPIASALITAGLGQLSLYWEIGDTKRKGRPDTVIHRSSPRWAEVCGLLEIDPGQYVGIIADLKTSGPAQNGKNRDPRAFRDHAYAYAYHWQLGWYRQGLRLTVEDGDWAGVLIQASTGTCCPVEVHRMGDREMDLGERAMEDAIALHRDCALHDTWPSTLSAARPHAMTFETWQFAKEEGF